MVKKYNITIKDTLHTNKECLASMIKALVGNRKSVDNYLERKTDGKVLRGQEFFKKKISSES